MNKLVAVALLSVTGFAAWQWHAAEPASDAKLLQDRLWVDHVPKNDRDPFNVFAVLSEEPLGTFQRTSLWRGQYENFRYELSGAELRVLFPQTADKERLRVSASRCNTEGMDFCLEIEGSTRGVKRYYSRKGWEIGKLDQAHALADSLEK